MSFPGSDAAVRRRVFLASLAATIVFDGAAHHLGAAVSLVLFSILLVANGFDDMRRVELRRLRATALLAAVGVTLLALWQVEWHTAPGAAHPVWDNRAEQFGEIGGTLSVNRLQPLWEIPGSVLPFVAFAAAVPLFRTTRSGENLWVSLAIGGAVFALYGLAQKTFFPDWQLSGERLFYRDSLTGFYVNRNAAAALLVTTSMATLVTLDRLLGATDLRRLRALPAAASRADPMVRRLWFFAGCLLLQVVAALLTKSRAGMAMIAVVVVGYGLARGGHHLRRAGFSPSRRGVAVALAGVALVLAAIGSQVLFRLDTQGAGDENRLCIYSAVVRMIGDTMPWGVGLGGFADAFPPYRRPECGISGIWDTAHDGYLQGLATMGVAFVALVIVLVVSLAPPLIRAAHSERSGVRLHARATLAVTLLLLLHTLVDFPLEIPGTAIVLGVMMASVVGMATDRADAGSRRRRRRTSPPSPRAGPVPPHEG